MTDPATRLVAATQGVSLCETYQPGPVGSIHSTPNHVDIGLDGHKAMITTPNQYIHPSSQFVNVKAWNLEYYNNDNQYDNGRPLSRRWVAGFGLDDENVDDENIV